MISRTSALSIKREGQFNMLLKTLKSTLVQNLRTWMPKVLNMVTFLKIEFQII